MEDDCCHPDAFFDEKDKYFELEQGQKGTTAGLKAWEKDCSCQLLQGIASLPCQHVVVTPQGSVPHIDLDNV